MIVYQHSQPGIITRIALGISSICFWGILFLSYTGQLELGKTPEETRLVSWILTGLGILIVFVFALFHNLTVIVDQENIIAKFGIGLVTKRVYLSGVESCRQVRNSFIWGWGIHKIPRGWLYNVSGLDAVELQLKDQNRVIRIGTDEPEALEAAVRSQLGRR